MIYTSYFANIKQIEKNKDGIYFAVSGLIPSFYSQLMKNNSNKYKRYIQFAPKKYWWQKWKNGELNNNDFIKLYYETVLNKIDIKDVLNQFNQYNKDMFLICYQNPNDFCHRHLIAQWLNNYNVECKQFICESNQLNLFK